MGQACLKRKTIGNMGIKKVSVSAEHPGTVCASVGHRFRKNAVGEALDRPLPMEPDEQERTAPARNSLQNFIKSRIFQSPTSVVSKWHGPQRQQLVRM